MNSTLPSKAPRRQPDGGPTVALESTVISHGLPYPHNLRLALRLEEIVRKAGATPATVGIIAGEIIVGLSRTQIEHLATAPNVRKVSRRDLPIVTARGLDGATTVATTAWAAHRVGIRVFTTGGIGGVHRAGPPTADRRPPTDERTFSDTGPSTFDPEPATGGFQHPASSFLSTDVSADLPELAQTPILVVCAGAKAILDLPATLEWLETYGVTVVGYGTDEFPAFYNRASGLPVDVRADTPAEVADLFRAQRALGLLCGMLVTVPVPPEFELPADQMEAAIGQALAEADAWGIKGKALTPFLLARISELTGEASLRANLALLENNAEVAARIAVALNQGPAR
jgi:pseudouridine-5'-phosphate glycosidase